MNRQRGIAKTWVGAVTGGVALLCLAAFAGRFLIVNAPSPSDVILVLAGETENRPAQAMHLLEQGYGRKVVIDVPAGAKVFTFAEAELAQRYIQSLPRANAISACSINGLSTKDESKDAEKCLAATGAKSVLIVTSDFHTRRALDIFRKEVPQYEYSAAAVHNPEQFGALWWTHRQWAKTLVDEWMRLVWWKCVDRWY